MTAKPWKSSSLFVQSNSYWHAKNRLDMLFEISMYLLTLNTYQRLKPNWISRIVVILNLHTVIHNWLFLYKQIWKITILRSISFSRHKPCCFYFNPQIEMFVLICGEIPINTFTQPIYRLIYFSLQLKLAIPSVFCSSDPVVQISCNIKEKWL